ncbi:MAG: hypothetical protein R6V67_01695 [Spirochaetia bacterium]
MNKGKPAKSGKSRGRRGGRNRNRKEPAARQAVKLSCVRCGEHIQHPEAALAAPDSGEPIHFDCAMEEVGKDEKLGQTERLCYLGHGNFGIISSKSDSSEKDFLIRKVISYENLEKEADWRKSMRNKVDSLR